MTSVCIETTSLHKAFGDKKALDSLNLSVDAGGIHAIVGSNGAGKSTLFRLLLGLDTPTSGSSTVLGVNSQNLSEKERGRIGYVNEEHTLPGWMTAEGVTQLQRSFYPQWDQTVYNRAIAYFDINPKQKVSGLSRGERAGLSLSIALAQQPELLILDEPTLGLDVVAKQSFLESLMFIGTENNATIIYCSHQMEEIERVADQLILMEQGRLINNSAPDDFVSRVSAWMVDFDGKPLQTQHIPGYLSSKRIDDFYQVMVTDQSPDIAGVLEQQGAASVQALPVNLEVAVNAFLSRNHHKPQGVQ